MAPIMGTSRNPILTRFAISNISAKSSFLEKVHRKSLRHPGVLWLYEPLGEAVVPPTWLLLVEEGSLDNPLQQTCRRLAPTEKS